MGRQPSPRGERVHLLARHLLLRDAPEPRVTQTVFLLLVSIDLTLRALDSTREEVLGPEPWPALGLSLVLAAQVVAALTPWRRWPVWLIGTLPVLDLVALGLLRLAPTGGPVGILALIPAIWLVWQFGARGLAVAVGLLALSLGALPAAYGEDGPDGAGPAHWVLDPLVAVLLATAMWGVTVNTRAGQAQIARRSKELDSATQELRQTRAFANAIFDSVDVGLVLLGPDGEYLTSNGRHDEFLALAFPHGHHGRAGQLGEVFAADGVRRLARHEMPSSRASQGEEFDDIRLWVGAEPDQRRALSVSARAVRDGGRLAGAALAYKDVTDFMRAMATQEEFLAVVSHEFRTPLTSISGYLSLLLDEEERFSPQDRKHLQVVARNTDRLLRLVTELLASAESDHHALEIDVVTSDIVELVNCALQAARPAAEAKGLDLDAEIPEVLTMRVDPTRLAQVLDNLISNAVKYTPAGGRVAVTVTTHPDHVEICVADTGIGISAAERERLFTPFFRTSAAQSSAVQGIGLGLSITKNIVEAHGGRIDVDSDATGSRFTVWLPIEAAGEPGDGGSAG